MLFFRKGYVYTVTRPYAGFRHPDRMAPDSSVWGGKLIALYGLEICSLRYWSFPAYFRNSEFSGDLHGHLSGDSLAYAGTLHSSMPEDISGIFRRFPCEKMKECAPGRIELVSWKILIFTFTTRPRLPYMKRNKTWCIVFHSFKWICNKE